MTVNLRFNMGELPEGASFASTGGLVNHFGIQRFAGGGRVLPFLRRGTDMVPAMLTPGEIILNAAQQQNVALSMSALRPMDTAASAEIVALRNQFKPVADYLRFEFKVDNARVVRDAVQKVRRA